MKVKVTIDYIVDFAEVLSGQSAKGAMLVLGAKNANEVASLFAEGILRDSKFMADKYTIIEEVSGRIETLNNTQTFEEYPQEAPKETPGVTQEEYQRALEQLVREQEELQKAQESAESDDLQEEDLEVFDGEEVIEEEQSDAPFQKQELHQEIAHRIIDDIFELETMEGKVDSIVVKNENIKQILLNIANVTEDSVVVREDLVGDYLIRYKNSENEIMEMMG